MEDERLDGEARCREHPAARGRGHRVQREHLVLDERKLLDEVLHVRARARAAERVGGVERGVEVHPVQLGDHGAELAADCGEEGVDDLVEGVVQLLNMRDVVSETRRAW